MQRASALCFQLRVPVSLTALGIWLALLAPAASAQNPAVFSPDVTALLGTIAPILVEDHDVAWVDAAGAVSMVTPSPFFPANVEVAAFHHTVPPFGIPLFVLDITVPLAGLAPGAPAEPRDVVSYDISAGPFPFSLVFDGSANGVPLNTKIDAVTTSAAGDLWLSFDTTLELPGVGFVDDEDLVEFTGAFSMVYDGSANGVAPGLDLDAAGRDPISGDLLLSFDASGSIAGLPFDDEDVLVFDLGTLTYASYFDGSAADVDWVQADLIAVPEPGAGLTLLSGAAALALLSQRARSRRSLPPRALAALPRAVSWRRTQSIR